MPSTGSSAKLCAATVSHLKDELLQNVWRVSKKPLTADQRTSKLQRLQAHIKQMPAGIAKQRLESFLTRLTGQSSVIGAVETEGTQTRDHTTQELQPVKASLARVESVLSASSVEGALLEPIASMPLHMQQPLKQCGLAAAGLRIYAKALRTLGDDMPALGQVDVRSMGTSDLTDLAKLLAINVKGKIEWQHAEKVRDEIANSTATPFGNFVLQAFKSSIMSRNCAYFQQCDDILPPGSLVRAKARKVTTLAMITMPSVWQESDGYRLAYRAVSLEDDYKYISFASSDVIKVICRTQVVLPALLPPLNPPDSLSGLIFDTMKQLPGITAGKVLSTAEALGIDPTVEAIVAWGERFLVQPVYPTFTALAESAEASNSVALEVPGLLLS